MARTAGAGPARDRGARALLAAERTALNFLQRLSGVATLTARYVRAVEGTGAQILDTRKTTPGLRALEKAAVLAGGGFNHRAGLYDMVLIKENHVALAGGVGAAVRAARAAFADLPLEVECRTRAEVDEALEAGAPRPPARQHAPGRAACDGRARRRAGRARGERRHRLRDAQGPRGHGRTLLSIGALTHSAPALDLSLILEPLP